MLTQACNLIFQGGKDEQKSSLPSTRLRRLRYISRVQPVRKLRVLLLGYLPPPLFGPAVAYQTLLRSEFAQRCDVLFLNVSVVKSIDELERFRIGKLFKMLRFAAHELLWLLARRPDFCCGPISLNARALLKDIFLLKLARWCGVRTVVYFHGTGLPAARERLSPRLRRWLDATIREAAGAIVIADCLRFNFDGLLPAEQIFTLTQGIEPLALPARTPHPFTILYLGALYRPKGVFDLLAAMPLLPDVKLIMAGRWFRANEQAEAEQYIRDHGLQIEFPGEVTGERKAAVLQAADVLAFPVAPEYEAFGLVMLDAMQAGLPIVATRGGARNEVVQDGVNGLLCEHQNPRDLADKIRQLAGDPALRQRMSESNRQEFAAKYTHEHFGRRFAEIFEALA